MNPNTYTSNPVLTNKAAAAVITHLQQIKDYTAPQWFVEPLGPMNPAHEHGLSAIDVPDTRWEILDTNIQGWGEANAIVRCHRFIDDTEDDLGTFADYLAVMVPRGGGVTSYDMSPEQAEDWVRTFKVLARKAGEPRQYWYREGPAERGWGIYEIVTPEGSVLRSLAACQVEHDRLRGLGERQAAVKRLSKVGAR